MLKKGLEDAEIEEAEETDEALASVKAPVAEGEASPAAETNDAKKGEDGEAANAQSTDQPEAEKKDE